MQKFPATRQRLVTFGLLSCILVGAVLASVALLAHNPSAKAASGAPVTINWNETHQPIDGFGIADPWPVDYLKSFPEPARSEELELLFSQTRGVGFSILRSEIGAGDGDPKNSNTETIEASEGNFTWNVDAGQVWLMQQAKGYGVTQYESTAWSPPAWMKTTNQVKNGGELRSDKYQAYADYLAAYIKGYHEHFGVDITQISPSNEPDQTTGYQSANWSGEQFRTFVRDYLKPTFNRQGITTRILLPEPSCWSDTLSGKNFAGPTFNDPQAAAAVDIIASHDYCGDATTPFTLAKQQGKHQWQTEVSSFGNAPADPWIGNALYWASHIHSNLVEAESNAWFYWLATHPAPLSRADNQSLLYQNSESGNFEITKRLFAIGNYSRFVRPGYVRIGATEKPASNVLVSAYKDPASGKTVIVAINNDTSNSQTLSLSFNGYSPSYLTPYVTSAGQSLEQNSSVAFTGGSAAVTLAPSSITTFVSGTGTVPTALEDPLIDLSQTYSHTNVDIDSSNWANFAGDSSHLYHTTNADANVVYRVSGGSSATVRDYYNKDAAGDGVIFKVSSDGSNFTTVTPTHDTPKAMNAGDWFEINYTIQIPNDASFFQIFIPANPYASWTPQITHVTLGAGPSTGSTATPLPPTPTPIQPTPTQPSSTGSLGIAAATTTATGYNHELLSNTYDGQIPNIGSYQCFLLQHGDEAVYTLNSSATVTSLKIAAGTGSSDARSFDVQVLQAGSWHTVLTNAAFPNTTGSFTTIAIPSNPTGVQAVKLLARTDWLYIDEVQFLGTAG